MRFDLCLLGLSLAFGLIHTTVPASARQSAHDELALRLIAATEQERARLHESEKAFFTVELVRALDLEGRRLLDRRDAARAEVAFQLEGEEAEKLADEEGIARGLEGIGDVHVARDDAAHAVEYFKRSLTVCTARGKEPHIANLAEKIGRTYYELRQYGSALEYSEQARQVFEQLGNKDRAGAVWLTTGTIYRAQGDFNRALECYQRAEALFESTGNKFELSRVTNSTAIVLKNQGNYSLSLEYLQKSLTAAEETGNKFGIANSLANSGMVYRAQNRYELALGSYRRAAAIYEELGNRGSLAAAYNSIGLAYKDMGNYTLAKESYEHSLTLLESLKRNDVVAEVWSNVGVLYHLQKELPQALEYFQKSLAFHESIGNRYVGAGMIHNIGRVHYDLGNYQQALSMAERAAATAEEIGSSELLIEVYDLTARVQFALGNVKAARAAYEKAIAALEVVRSMAAGGDQDRQRLMESWISPWTGMVQLLVKQNQPLEALAYAEQSRARVLLDVLQGGRTDIRKALDGREQEQERRLRGEITRLNTALSAATLSNKPDRSRIDGLKTELATARLDYEAFQIELYTKHPELRTERGEAPIIKPHELASMLPTSGSVLLEYVVTDDTSYLFVVTKSSANGEMQVRVHPLQVRRADLVKQVEAFRRQLDARDLGFRTASRALYDLLLKPAQSQLSGKTSLVIVPDDCLWDLPFQALLAGNNRYLLESSAISYAPSLTVLREMRKDRGARSAYSSEPTLLALGNPSLTAETMDRASLALRSENLKPLPEAEEEVRSLGRLYGRGRSKIYIGSEAREDRVKTEAGNARILHFATHATLNNLSPMYSALVLAQIGNNEDGLLEAWELMQLDLKADVAVLSACETARGRFGAGEGMIGLTWALFVAGVPTTVVSQWEVESASTRDLMLHFHRGMNGGSQSKAEALRQAALKLMKATETSHPFYWAGFVLIGDGR